MKVLPYLLCMAVVVECVRQVANPSFDMHGGVFIAPSPVEEVLKSRMEIAAVTLSSSDLVVEMQPSFPIRQIRIMRTGASGYSVSVAQNDTL